MADIDSLPLPIDPRPKRFYRSIPPRVLAYIAWRNLKSRRLRTSLTIGGVVVGIGAIYFLLSLGLGLRSIVTKEILGSQSVQAIDVLTPNSKIIKLDAESAERIKNLPHVQRESVSYSFPAGLSLKSSQVDGIVYGIDIAYQGLNTLGVTRGRLLNASDTKSAVVNQAALRSMGITDDRAAIGQTVNLVVPLKNVGAQIEKLEESFIIVGIIGTSSGSEVFVPKKPFDDAGVPYYTQIKILADASANVPQLRRQVESLGFQTASPLDTIDQINQIFRYFNIILVGFGAIGMIVAILGMFNTLTISLLERTKEIGLMIALGGRHKDMRRLFVIEAIILSLIGAIIGIVLATLTGGIINAGMNLMAHRRGITQPFELFAAPVWLTVSMLLFMIVIGLLVVYYPARRAERINPIDALRRE